MFLAFCLNSGFSQVTLPTGIYINELMASNSSTIQDPEGNYSDWVEIFNNTNASINLNNYYISDDAANLTKFQLQTSGSDLIIGAGAYLVLWATGSPELGAKHLGFSFSASGEDAYLTAPDGTTIISSFSYGVQRSDISYGYLPSNPATLRYFASPSPGSINSSSNTYVGFLNPPIISHESGIYASNITISVSSDETGANIVYSTDGSDPSSTNLSGSNFHYKNTYPSQPGNATGPTLSMSYNSTLYSSPITVSNANNLPNKYVNINSTFQGMDYAPGNAANDKVRIFKFRVEKAGYLPSEVVCRTFIVGNRDYNLPIFSVQISPEQLWDLDDGMYVAGRDFLNWRAAYPNTNGYSGQYNFFREQDASGHVTFLGKNAEKFDHPWTVAIQGGTSRYYPNKGLKFSTKNTLYDEHDIDFFEEGKETTQGFVLRNSGNDYWKLLLKDAAIHQICLGMNFEKERVNQSVIFLNGEYWGITNLRDRVNDNFLSLKYNMDKDDIEIGKNSTIDNSSGDYEALLTFVKSNNLTSTSNYEYLKTKINISSFIDYSIAQSYFANSDALNSNYGYWRYKGTDNSSGTAKDGKWRWLFYDLDLAFLNETPPYAPFAPYEIFYSGRGGNYFYKYIKSNNEFKVDFVNRYADLLNSVFDPVLYTNHIIDSLASNIEDEVPYHIARWKYPDSFSEWQGDINYFKNRIVSRKPTIWNATLSEFGISGTYNLSVVSSELSKGFVKVNSLNIKNNEAGISNNPNSWTGQYFDNIPLKIVAKPEVGYKFTHWLVNGSTILYDSTITVITSSNITYEAFFELHILSDNPFPEAFSLDSCKYSLLSWNPNEAAGSYPNKMAFIYYSKADPELSDTNIGGLVSGQYGGLNSRTRINGLGEQGFSFINTGGPNENPGFPFGKLGGAILALNTNGIDSVQVSWTGRTIAANTRKYALQLMYRIGDVQAFNSFSPPIIYFGNSSSGHSQVFENIVLPDTLLNQPYVQLLWRYYYLGGGSGSRDELAVDDIRVKSIYKTNKTRTAITENIENPSQIISTDKISSTAHINYIANEYIELLPGFSSEASTIFKAEIRTCD